MRTPVVSCEEPTCITAFDLNDLFKAQVCKYGHILRYWESGHRHMNLGDTAICREYMKGHSTQVQFVPVPHYFSRCRMGPMPFMTSALQRYSPLRSPVGNWLGGNIINIRVLMEPENLILLLLFRCLDLDQTHNLLDSLPDSNN